MRALLLTAALLAAPHLATAADLVFGRASEQSSIDPHFSQTGPNQATASAIFERLVTFDDHLQLHPALATSWEIENPLAWIIHLRPGVLFHDGSTLTAADVAYSLDRVRHIPRSPAPFTHAVTNVAAVEIIDPLTLRIRTAKPTPLLMEQIGLVYILPAKLGPDVGNEQFNTGQAAVGTGPYRFQSWVPNDRVVLIPSPDWWGGKPEWDRITLRFIPNAAARVAALLAGDVDLIDSVPPADSATLARNPAVALYSSPTNRIIYLAVDAARAHSPFITASDGKNPLQDVRVRRALSMMINRKAIAERVLNGAAVPAGQIVPPGEGGHADALQPTAYDPTAAKALLAEAGYPKGFTLTLHSSSDRYPGDAQVAQAVGQAFSRDGLQVSVDVQPYTVYAGAATAQKFSLFLFGWSSSTGNSSEALRSILATYDPANGLGALNRTRYSNPAFDAALTEATTTFDEQERNALLARATEIAMHDEALLPLYWQKAIWAARPNVTFDANMSEDSTVLFAHPRPSP